MPAPPPATSPVSRRQFMRDAARVAAVGCGGGLLGLLASRADAKTDVWQLDPQSCVRCGRCATSCVLEQSAVKCFQLYPICGYCKLCTGYFVPEPNALTTAAENQLCPTGAIKRKFIEDPYYEYSIDAELCIGCAKCVEGCTRFGNGSFYLQMDQRRCLNCNECSIAKVCPSEAFRRVPVDQPYIAKNVSH